MATPKLISSGTVRHPYLIVWVGALLLLAVVQLSGVEEKDTFFVIIASLAVLLSLGIKINDWEWNLVDEVSDCGDYLVVKYHGEEEIVPISNITGVAWTDNRGSARGFQWGVVYEPPRITLRLAQRGKFGQIITFYPNDTDTNFIDGTNMVVEDLKARVRKSRSCSAT